MIDQELLVAIPTGRTPQVAAFLIPGVNLNNVDVGGTNIINTTGGSLSVHGGSIADTRLLIDGVTIANTEGTGWSANMLPNMGSTQEVAVDYSSATAESITGGLQINMIPKTGGNRFSGSLFATAVNSSFEGTNNDDDLVARGLRTPNSLKLQSTSIPGFGGPLERDKLWFYTSARFTRQANYVGGLFQNKNAGDITKWTVRAGHEQPAFNNATEREREPAPDLAGEPDEQAQLLLRPALALPVRGHHADRRRRRRPTTSSTRSAICARWPTRPRRSNRLLVEARFGMPARGVRVHAEQPRGPAAAADPRHRAGRTDPGPAVSGRRVSTAHAALPAHARRQHSVSASLSYVTGSHSFKFGFYNVTAQRDSTVRDNVAHLTYRFNNGVPNQLTQRATPLVPRRAPEARPRHLRAGQVDAEPPDAERRRAVRSLQSYFPEQTLEPGPLVPTRNLTFPKTDDGELEGLVPRLGAVVRPVRRRQDGAQGVAQQVRDRAGPAGHLRRHGQPGEPPRQHRDAHLDRRERELRARLRPDQRAGAGHRAERRRSVRHRVGHELRPADAQPELRPGGAERLGHAAVPVGVLGQRAARAAPRAVGRRRLFPPLVRQLRRHRQPQSGVRRDFGTFSVTAPVDARLPDGGGYTVTGFYDVNPDKVAAVPNNYFTLARTTASRSSTGTAST